MQKTKKVTKVTSKVKKVSNKKATAPAKSSKPVFKLDPARTKIADKLLDKMYGEDDLQAPGLIKQILQLYTNKFSCKEIIAYGFNKSTVYRQTHALDMLKAAHTKKQLTSKGVTMLTGKNS